MVNERSEGETRPLVLMGARQTGKSTFARKIAATDGRPYLSLDDLDVRAIAESDPAGLLARGERLVLDEVQRVPVRGWRLAVPQQPSPACS